MAGSSAPHPGESQAVKNIRYVKGKVTALYQCSPRDRNVLSFIELLTEWLGGQENEGTC